ncbi:DEAD/DEAH box helicase family protein [Mucilaginibacter angelicae]|uniref:DEAD/DEAH box helicase family protein n=1 Tax=Mucilaginibacter angelicae TaxID=869718 RepID=A0ABV6L6S9_9SPHI
MYQSTTTYNVAPTIRLDKIMPHGLPINSFIDKGRCAIGGTYSEINNKTRCTIIVVPNISIELSKQRSHPEMDIVYGEVTRKEVEEIFLLKKVGHKIMTTPEGMLKIMTVAEGLGIVKQLYDNWFLLLDEAHTFISEAYRKDILAPFIYFWSFKAKSIISATPFEFSDPIFKTLHHHKITFTDTLGKVTLVKATSIVATLNYLLSNLDKYPGNIHIYFNSVKDSVAAIKRAGLRQEQCNIFCANDKEGENMKKLGDLIGYFLSEPVDGCYKKVNFYTCKYFEGWDLYDSNATMVFVSDINKPQTCLGPKTKGKQAFGRLRLDVENKEEPHRLIHITNARSLRYMNSIDKFITDFYAQGYQAVSHWNEKVALLKSQKRAIPTTTEIIKFADIDNITKNATLIPLKLDQQINFEANKEVYNHIDFIKKDWEDGYFDVEVLYADHKIETNTIMKRKSKATQLKEDYQALKAYNSERLTTTTFNFGLTVEQEIQSSNPTAYLAFKLLDESTLESLKYNVKKVETAIILKENSMAELKLARLLNQQFKPGSKYTNDTIKSKLQTIYNQLNIRNTDGTIKVAKATELAKHNWYEMKPCSIKEDDGGYENGQLIIRAHFNLLMAA